MTINATAIILLALYIAVARRQGVAPQRRSSGTMQNDILKEYVARGTYIYPPRPSLRIVTDIFAFCERELPQWNTISISGYHIREAGSTAVQEVAFTLANAIAYVQAAIDAGLDVNAFGQRLSFFFNAHNDFLEEIAKFRAARRLWARIMRDRFGATNPRAQQLRFHTQTAGSTLTAQQPDNNIVRVALQALAAVLGGTQSLHCNGRDEALALPTEESATIALRTQQIILHESGVAQHGRSGRRPYAIEEMTDRDRARGRATCSTGSIALGGTLAAIESGFIQRQIQDVGVSRAAGDRCRRRGRGRRQPLRGQTAGAVGDRRLPHRSRRRTRSRSIACARVRAGRSERDWRAALDAVERAARGTATISCRRSSPPSRQRATLGEIADTHARACSASTSEHPTLMSVDDARPAARRAASDRDVRRRRSANAPSTTSASRSAPGETLGLVGESGSGKSVTAFSILRLLQPPGRIIGGTSRSSKAATCLRCRSARCAQVRGARISLIFQEPMTALNPVMRVGDQIAEALTVHGIATRAEARAPRRRTARRGAHSRRRRGASATTRTSCPAACGSA